MFIEKIVYLDDDDLTKIVAKLRITVDVYCGHKKVGSAYLVAHQRVGSEQETTWFLSGLPQIDGPADAALGIINRQVEMTLRELAGPVICDKPNRAPGKFFNQ